MFTYTPVAVDNDAIWILHYYGIACSPVYMCMESLPKEIYLLYWSQYLYENFERVIITYLPIPATINVHTGNQRLEGD